MRWSRIMLMIFTGLAGAGLTLRGYAENIVVFGPDAYPPLIYLEQGKPAGILPALFVRLAQDTGDKYDLQLLPWRRAMLYSEHDKGGISVFSWTQGRAEHYDFSQPMYDDDIQLVVRKGHEFRFATLADLHGKRIGAASGASYGEEIDQAIAAEKLQLVRDNGQRERLMKLLNGQLDAAIIGNGRAGFNRALALDAKFTAPQAGFQVLDKPLVRDPLHLAFSKSMHMQPALGRFNKALQAFKQTAEYQQLLESTSIYSPVDHE
jgi:polar amino acid transport system substrate-binding protein